MEPTRTTRESLPTVDRTTTDVANLITESRAIVDTDVRDLDRPGGTGTTTTTTTATATTTGGGRTDGVASRDKLSERAGGLDQLDIDADRRQAVDLADPFESGVPDASDQGGRVASTFVDRVASGHANDDRLADVTGDFVTREERQEERAAREAAIEEAHDQGLAYYDGTTTIGGEEVEVWIMPNGSTVYWDADDETVVKTKWESDAAHDAAVEAAQAADEPFYDGTTTVNGEDVEVWVMPDGSTVYYDRDTETTVGIEWPNGETPEYQGVVSYDGETCSLYELPNGEQVIIDGDGEIVGYLDDVELDTFNDPIYGEVYSVPMGDPSYDTVVYDADTGEPVIRYSTGTELPGDVLTYYQPTGEDYVLVIDADGNVIGAFELPPDEVWSVLGIVTYYDDGSLTVDVGAAEMTVDLGAEGGIWFSSDGLGELIPGADWLGSVEAGVEWDDSGIGVDVSADVLGVGSFGYGFEVGSDGFDGYVDVAMQLSSELGIDLHVEGGLTEDGRLYAGADASIDMTIPGGPGISLDAEAYVEVGAGGFEAEYGWDGKVSMLGFYVEGGEHRSVVYDEDGLTYTQDYYRGMGIAGVGSVRAGGEMQLHTDGTRDGTTAEFGTYVASADRHGEETGMTGLYTTADEGGLSTPEVRHEHLDTGVTREDYDRHHDQVDENMPVGPDGSADFESEMPDLAPGEAPDEPGPRRNRLPLDRDADAVAQVETAIPGARSGQPAGARDGDRRERPGAGFEEIKVTVDEVERPGAGFEEIKVTVRDDERAGVFVEEVSVVRDQAGPGADSLFSTHGAGTEFDGAPEGAQAASSPAPPPPEEETKPDPPKIFKRRDGDAKTPEDEEPVEPDPTPKPAGERPELWPRDDDPIDEPTTPTTPIDPKNLPPISTERLMDVDEDGDGVPDRWGTGGPILGDDDLGDLADGPVVLRATAGQTVSSGADQSPDSIERPDGDGLLSFGTATSTRRDVGAKGDLLGDDITALPLPTGGGDPGPEGDVFVPGRTVVDPVAEVGEAAAAPVEPEPIAQPTIEIVEPMPVDAVLIGDEVIVELAAPDPSPTVEAFDAESLESELELDDES